MDERRDARSEVAEGFFPRSGIPFSAALLPAVSLSVAAWNRDTLEAICRALVSISGVNGAPIETLRALIRRRLGVGQVFLCGSGSLALELALRAFGVGRGDEVVLPTLCCAAVVLPVLATGATAVLADVGPELNLTAAAAGAALTQKTRAIVVPHLFGNPAEIEAIVELARARNVRVIDDAAQALGATIAGRAVGSFGDAGLLSFGPQKICAGLGGGALIAREQIAPARPGDFALEKPAALPAIRNLWSALAPQLFDRLGSAGAPGPDAPPRWYRKEKMAKLNAAVAVTLMQSLCDNLGARRYSELLQGVEGIELIAHRAGSACLTQVVRVRATRVDRAAAVVEALRRAGHRAQGSYVPIHRLTHYSMCVWDNVSFADRIWSELIELPCEPHMKLEDVERIAAIVKSAARN